MKIALDCLGGDNGYRIFAEAAARYVSENSDTEFILFGNEKEITEALDEVHADLAKISVIDAPEAVSGEDKPTDAVRLKKNSSMMSAIRLLREDETVDALVSTGPTGVLVAASTLRIGRIRGIRRPAFCPIVPSMDGGIVGICDSGANVECTPEMLHQFAIMGSEYLKCAFGAGNPRIALLNVGTESEKGDELRKEAYRMLSSDDTLNFVGNMESRDVLSGRYDLIVCDGFSGNVLIKTVEGTAMELLKRIKKDIMSKTVYKIGALFMKKMFLEEKELLNYQNYGGSVLLGTEKVIVKGHGSSDATAVYKCIEQASRMVSGKMNQKIKEKIEGSI